VGKAGTSEPVTAVTGVGAQVGSPCTPGRDGEGGGRRLVPRAFFSPWGLAPSCYRSVGAALRRLRLTPNVCTSTSASVDLVQRLLPRAPRACRARRRSAGRRSMHGDRCIMMIMLASRHRPADPEIHLPACMHDADGYSLAPWPMSLLRWLPAPLRGCAAHLFRA
jgi:hypothetical protein